MIRGPVADTLPAPQPAWVRSFVPIIRRWLAGAGVDRAVVWGAITRVWGLATGPTTALLIAWRFTPEVQGYYYTFAAVLGLQTFAELGLGQSITQFASHEWAYLHLDDQGRIGGDPRSLSRLASLARFAFRWYAAATVTAAVVLSPVGLVLLSRADGHGTNWVGPWLALCILTSLSFYLLPVWAVLEGCNQIASVYRYRLILSVISTLSAWLAVWSGAGLWTAPFVTLSGLIWAGIFLYSHYRRFLLSLLSSSSPSSDSIGWRQEILPFQWRMAVSAISGYLFYSLFTPIAFRARGPAFAGQVGMTWSVASSLSSIPSTLIMTKVPRLGMLIARRDYSALDRLIFRSGAAALVAATAAAGAFETLLILLGHIGHPLASRLLPPVPTGLFLLATVLLQISYCQSTYLRAHKKEPFLVLSILAGVLTALLAVLLVGPFGGVGLAVAYLAVVAVLMLPLGTVIWYRCRKAWHS